MTTKEIDSLAIIPERKSPHQNLAFLALKLLKKTYKIKKFARITIKKNIPLSSGLGGASSDAAATLKGLNTLWHLKISPKKLLRLAAKLGMDVPFFIIGGTALGTHFGEKITPLPALKNIKFQIFPKPENSQSYHLSKHHDRNNSIISAHLDPFAKTALAYASLDLSICGKNLAKTKELTEILKQNPTKKFSKKYLQKALLSTLHNDFETLPAYKNLPPPLHLTGSGPTTFDMTIA